MYNVCVHPILQSHVGHHGTVHRTPHHPTTHANPLCPSHPTVLCGTSQDCPSDSTPSHQSHVSVPSYSPMWDITGLSIGFHTIPPHMLILCVRPILQSYVGHHGTSTVHWTPTTHANPMCPSHPTAVLCETSQDCPSDSHQSVCPILLSSQDCPHHPTRAATCADPMCMHPTCLPHACANPITICPPIM